MKAIKQINPLVGALTMLDGMVNDSEGDEREHRKDVFCDEWDDIVVDTCVNPATETWETGVSINKAGKWVIVQQYPDRDKANTGHKKWVAKLKKNPQVKLHDIDVWGIGRQA